MTDGFISSQPAPFVSVIIPTYNRSALLRQVLAALEGQSYPRSSYEIIVVDDGSTDGTDELFRSNGDLSGVGYIRQGNQGPGVARNVGARAAHGRLLVFLDDDIVPAPDLVSEHVACQMRRGPAIVVGLSQTVLPPSPTPFAKAHHGAGDLSNYAEEDGTLPPAFCLSGNMSIWADQFLTLNGFEGALSQERDEWTRWEDTEFGWRAAQAGIPIVYQPRARGLHHDYSVADLRLACQRWQILCSTAPLLFARHPELEKEIHMVRDKGPVVWGDDSPRLVVRKILRRILAWPPVLIGMETAVRLLHTWYPRPRLLRPLYRWIIGSYMCRGYRQGLRLHQSSNR